MTQPNTEGPRLREFATRFCRHTTGPDEGQLIELRPWQAKVIDEIFALRPDGLCDSASDGQKSLWKYRQALVILPRKCGKSELGSIIALYGLVACKERGAQIYAAAGSKDQARIVFGAAKAMVLADPLLSERCLVQRNQILNKQTGSVFRVVSSDAKLQHGLNPLLTICDETWGWPNGELAEALLSGSGARPQSLLIHITTPGSGQTGYLWDLVQHGKRVQSGEVEDPTFYMHWNEPDPAADHRDPNTWAKYHPAYGDWVSADFLQSQLQQLPESEFRRLHLAAWTAAREAWLPWGAWQSLGDSASEGRKSRAEIQDGETVLLGVDAAYSGDSTGIVAATPDGRIAVLGHWETDGTPGWRTPFSEVRQTLLDASKRFNVVEIACDPYWLSALMQELAELGLPMVEFRTNSMALMVPAVKKFFDGVMDAQLSHDDNPALARHLDNCRIKTDKYGTRITKEAPNSPNKIDLAVCAVIAWDRASRYRAPVKARVRVW